MESRPVSAAKALVITLALLVALGLAGTAGYAGYRVLHSGWPHLRIPLDPNYPGNPRTPSHLESASPRP